MSEIICWQDTLTQLLRLLTNVEVSGPGVYDMDSGMALWRDLATRARDTDHTLYFVGNGASASMSSHFAADLSKNASIRTRVFTDLAELTATGNDVGFEHIFALPLSRQARQGDMLIAISSSGRSPNIISAVQAARERGVQIVTLSGFDAANPLRASGMLNFYVAAHAYGLVETCHAAILHFWTDLMI